MGSYEETSWADIRLLTRARRKQSREGKLPSWVYDNFRWDPVKTRQCVRFSARGAEFSASIAVFIPVIRSKNATKSWRKGQWHVGNRCCYYCGVKMTLGCIGKGKRRAAAQNANPPHNLATVDHRHPLVLGGEDGPRNYAMACWLCNNRKGSKTEAEFRRLMPLAAAA